MGLTILMLAIGLVIFLILPIIGGAGLLIGIFGGLKSIPSFVIIGIIIMVVLLLFRRLK